MNTIINFTKASRIVTLILFAIALTQPTYCSGSDCGGFGDGFVALLIGWLGILFKPSAYFAWLANPLMIAAWFYIPKLPNLATFFYLIASIICLCFLKVEKVIDAQGEAANITGFCSGYWLWTSSAIVGFVGSLSIWMMKLRHKKQD